MRLIALTAVAIMLATASASARTPQDHAPIARAWYDDVIQWGPTEPATRPLDNRRPPFASHIGPNGQGVD